MNFPGLDPAWTLAHRALHRFGRERTWSLSTARAALARGEKVLVVATTALGDSILTTPLLETLAHHLGRERVSLLVKAPYADLYRDDPRIGRVFTVRGKYRWENLGAELKTDPHRIALLANLTEPDLTPFLRWGGVRAFLRYRSRGSRFPAWIANREMLREPGAPDYATGHAIENNLAMAEALGLDPTTHRLALPQLQTGTERDRMVLIHPGASRENKRWGAKNWACVADAVVANFDLEIGLTGHEQEQELARAVQAEMKFPARAQILAGQLSLRELAQRQARAQAFLSGDTGPYHLALAVGCPTVTLFAPTDRGSSVEACGPHAVNPLRHRSVQTKNLGDAVTSLSFVRVWAEVHQQLANR